MGNMYNSGIGGGAEIKVNMLVGSCALFENIFIDIFIYLLKIYYFQTLTDFELKKRNIVVTRKSGTLC
jgi:hypothetical protein